MKGEKYKDKKRCRERVRDGKKQRKKRRAF